MWPWPVTQERERDARTPAFPIYCDKHGELFTAFTPAQLDRQRRLCERSYDGFFGVQGFMRDGITGTGTFCSTALPVRP